MSYTKELYRRSGFNCEILLIVNCNFFYDLQSKESQVKEYAMNITCNHAPSTRAVVHSHTYSYFCTYSLAIEIEMSLCQYFMSTVNLVTPSQAQLSPTQRTLVSHPD